MRPIICILSARSVGYGRDDIVPLALAFELIHNATLVHDDIIDRDGLRRGGPTLHRRWSLEDAIIAGDALISLAIGLSADYGPEVIKLVSRCSLELCEGERMELGLSLDRATEEDYFTKVRKKSASLFRVAAQAGAIVGGGTTSEVECLAHFGERFGIAYQIRDDLADLIGIGESGSSDLEIGRVTLPLIHFYQSTDESEKEVLGRCFGNKGLSKEVIGELVSAMEETGSIRYCERKIVENLESAYDSLKAVKETTYKELLTGMLGLIVEDCSTTTFAGVDVREKATWMGRD